MTAIAVGAPKNPYSDIKGYFYMLPITETPPANGYEPLPESKVNVGLVGGDGPSLTAEIDAEMLQDWNLDDVLQVKNGANASLEVPVFGWGEDQARVIYGPDSVITTAGGFKVVWSGELPPHVWLVLELRGKNSDARLVVDAQVNSPGGVTFATNQAITHTVSAALFKNSTFLNAKGDSGFFALYDETEPEPEAWAATTAYGLGEFVTVGAGTLEATTAGTSDATIPTLPGAVGGTVVDGTVTWTRRS